MNTQTSSWTHDISHTNSSNIIFALRTRNSKLVHIRYANKWLTKTQPAYDTFLLHSLVMSIAIISSTAMASIASGNNEGGFDSDVTIGWEVYGLYEVRSNGMRGIFLCILCFIYNMRPLCLCVWYTCYTVGEWSYFATEQTSRVSGECSEYDITASSVLRSKTPTSSPIATFLARQATCSPKRARGT